jgi:hypothetical protein
MKGVQSVSCRINRVFFVRQSANRQNKQTKALRLYAARLLLLLKIDAD